MFQKKWALCTINERKNLLADYLGNKILDGDDSLRVDISCRAALEIISVLIDDVDKRKEPPQVTALRECGEF